jgi:hypothetical protein
MVLLPECVSRCVRQIVKANPSAAGAASKVPATDYLAFLWIINVVWIPDVDVAP